MSEVTYGFVCDIHPETAIIIGYVKHVFHDHAFVKVENDKITSVHDDKGGGWMNGSALYITFKQINNRQRHGSACERKGI